jgi:mannose-6-phosphate isomerase-like protein (cupin superfamily)
LEQVRVANLLNDDAIENISVAIINLNRTNSKVINRLSDTIYYILEGEGIFNISDENIIVQKGDLIYIKKNTPYFN